MEKLAKSIISGLEIKPITDTEKQLELQHPFGMQVLKLKRIS